MKKTTTRIVSLLLVAVLTLSMAACGDKPTSEPSSGSIIENSSSLSSSSSSTSSSSSGSSTSSSSSSSSSSSVSTGVAKDTRTPADIQKDILGKMTSAYQKNEDVVGYLYFPSTTISEPVVHDSTGHDYYIRKNWQRQDDYNGCYFGDKRVNFGSRSELSKNTVIYGHSMSDDPASKNGKIMFGQLNLLRDLNFAKENQFIYFSTPKSGMVWQIFAAYLTTENYNYIEANPTSANLQNIINHARERSMHNYDINVTSSDKILTLSTCTYKIDGKELKYPNDYRYVVVAKLVDEKAALTPVKVETNPSPKAP